MPITRAAVRQLLAIEVLLFTARQDINREEIVLIIDTQPSMTSRFISFSTQPIELVFLVLVGLAEDRAACRYMNALPNLPVYRAVADDTATAQVLSDALLTMCCNRTGV